jgi:hypothetical protein
MMAKDHLTKKEIAKKVNKRLKKYKRLGFLGSYAMFMGTAQVLEIALKNVLADCYKVGLDKTENLTLGQTKNELKKHGLRSDFLRLLESVVEKRKYIAHELLANEAITRALIDKSKPKKHFSKEARNLSKAIYELEQLMVLLKWTSKRSAW